MCELLVRVVDKPRSGNLAVDCQRSGRGDVIAACEDGHAWSHLERTSPDWMIVRVPGMTLTEGQALTSAEPAMPTGAVPQLRHKRLFHLDADSLFGPHPGRRAQAVVAAYLADVRGARHRKASVPNPNVIGHQQHPQVIG